MRISERGITMKEWNRQYGLVLVLSWSVLSVVLTYSGFSFAGFLVSCAALAYAFGSVLAYTLVPCAVELFKDKSK